MSDAWLSPRLELREGSVSEAGPANEVRVVFDSLGSGCREVCAAQWRVEKVERPEGLVLLRAEQRKQGTTFLPVG